jgi:MraZ protein
MATAASSFLKTFAPVTFVGLGDKFQMWEPKRFEERRAEARSKVQVTRKLFAAGGRSSEDGGDEGARE